MNVKCLIVVLSVVGLSSSAQAQLTTANGVIRWYEMERSQQSAYQMNLTVGMNAFRLGDSQYSVVLTGEYNSFLRLNTSDGSYFEYKGVSSRDQQPLFKPLDASGKFRGKILFPARLGEKDRRDQSWGNQPVDFDSLNLIPCKSGFKAVVVDDDSAAHGMAISTDDQLKQKDIFSNQMHRKITFEGAVRSSDSAVLFMGSDDVSCFILGLRDGSVTRHTYGHPREIGVAGTNRDDVVTPISLDQNKFLMIVQEPTITRFDRRIKKRALRDNLIHDDKAPCCTVGGGRLLAAWLKRAGKAELHLIDTTSLETVDQFAFDQHADLRVSIGASSNVLALHIKDGPFMVFDCSENRLSLIGRSSPLLHELESCEDWSVSDDGKKIFFIGTPTSGDRKPAIGEIDIADLKPKSGKEANLVPAGLATMQQKDISFDHLPAGAGKELVGVLSGNIQWKEFSPDDRWLFGDGSGSQLFHTGTGLTHRIADHAHHWGFGRDSNRIVLKNNDGWQIWDLSGNTPLLVVATEKYDRSLSGIDGLLDNTLRLHIDEKRVLATSEKGSFLLNYDSKAIKLAFEAPLKGEYSNVADDWSEVTICKKDGSVWRYKLTDANAEGISKSVLPQFIPQSFIVSLGRDGKQVFARSTRDYHSWRDDGSGFSTPITVSDKLGSFVSVSQNGKWIALKERQDGQSKLLLLDDQLREHASLQLTSQDFHNLVITNDGRHVLIPPWGQETLTYVFRIR